MNIYARAYLAVGVPFAVVTAAAVHLTARSADPDGCGWTHFLTLLAAQLLVAAVLTPILINYWRRP